MTSLDGYDEISLTAPFKIITPEREEILEPSAFDLPTVKPEEIAGGTSIAEGAKIFTAILEGKGTPAQRAVVIANAALGIHAARPGFELMECIAAASESLRSGQASRVLKTLTGLNPE